MKAFYAGGFLYNPKTKEVFLHKRDGNTNINPHKWGVFGGLCEDQETPIQTCIREMHEELGVEFANNEIIPLCDYLNTERDTHRYVFYVVSDKKKEEMILGEGADFDWILLDKVFEYDLTDKTRDDINTFIRTKV